MPYAEVRRNSVNLHLLVCEAVIPQLFEILVNSLLYYCFAFVALKVLDLDDVYHFVVFVCYDDVGLDSLAELFNCLLSVYFQVL